MKKLIITSALFAFAAAPVFAQSARVATNTQAQQANQNIPSADKMAEREVKMLQQQYKLSPAQASGAQKVCTEYAQSMLAMRAEHRQMTPQEAKALFEKKNAGLKAVMTADQYKAYESTLNLSKPQAAPATNKAKN